VALSRQHVLDVRRARVSHLAPQDTGVLELCEALGESRRGDRPECLAELGEASAPLVGCVEDRHGVAALEDVRRAADVLGYGLVTLTP
jgi:hypothetical protein